MHDHKIAFLRSFNRFYTGIIGLLDEGYLQSEFSLTEVRIMYELHARKSMTARELVELLKLDKGYVSRIITKFEKKKIVERTRSDSDLRSFGLSLSKSGKAIFLKLNDASQEQARQILSSLTSQEASKLISNMNAIMQILQKKIGAHG
ncbi:MAG: MarR family transcriptional regulator [Bacteroidetes bacterium]|nr:MarR family transcriptional regulator [Bacteroidota bacterium]